MPHCCICWGDEDREWAATPCGHIFHFTCINQALQITGPKCPYCRTDVVTSRGRPAVIKLFFDEEQNDNAVDEVNLVDNEDVAGLRSKLDNLQATTSRQRREVERLRQAEQEMREKNVELVSEVRQLAADAAARESTLQRARDNANELDRKGTKLQKEVANLKVAVEAERKRVEREKIINSRLVISLDPSLVGEQLAEHLLNMVAVGDCPPTYFKDLIDDRNRRLATAANKAVRAETEASAAATEVRALQKKVSKLQDKMSKQLLEIARLREEKQELAAELLEASHRGGAAYARGGGDGYRQERAPQFNLAGESAMGEWEGGAAGEAPAVADDPLQWPMDEGSRLPPGVLRQRKSGCASLPPLPVARKRPAPPSEPGAAAKRLNSAAVFNSFLAAPETAQGLEDEDDGGLEIVSDGEEEQQQQSSGPLAGNENNPLKANQAQANRRAGVSLMATAGPSKLGMAAAPGASFIPRGTHATTGLQSEARFIHQGPDGKGGRVTVYRSGGGTASAAAAPVVGGSSGRGGLTGGAGPRLSLQEKAKRFKMAFSGGATSSGAGLKIEHFFDKKSN